MASEQLVRSENTTTEREAGVEKDKVPKMTDHFEQLAEQVKESDITGGKDTPQGSIEALQGGEHAGKAVGDVGGRGKGRETHELGVQFESLADKVKGEDHKEKVSDHAANVVGSEGAARERDARDVGKLETKTEGEERGNKDKGREAEEEKDKEKVGGRVGAENEGANATTACTLEQGDTENEKRREESEGSTWEQISNYRDQATENVKERYERAKEAASETLNNTAQTTTEAKDATVEKGQQGYAATKDTISSAAKTASEKAKSAGSTTASFVGEKAVQAKDATVASGKSAAEYAGKVAGDLKDKATAAGWAAAHFSTEKTVEGTKAAAHVVEGAAGYAGHKAAELASMSAGAVKGLAASAGDTAKGYTAKKKQEAQRELEAKKASQPQLGEERPSQGIGETVSKVGGQEEGKGVIGQSLTSISEKLGDTNQREVLLDNITEGRGEVLGSVGETVAEI